MTLPLSPSLPCTPSPIPTPLQHLLLQDNTIHARLEQRAHQARFALQQAQSVQDLCGGVGAQLRKQWRELMLWSVIFFGGGLFGVR
jgi:hypothetical protein